MKKIYITRKQLEEVLGADFAYLKNQDSGIKNNNGNSEIFTGDIADDDEEDTKPVTTDKIANSRSPRNYWGARYIRTGLRCSKENKKKVVTESNSELENNEYIIPDDLYNTLQNNLRSVNQTNNIEGIQRLKNLINKRNISYSEMYRLKDYFDKADKSTNEYNLLGGNTMGRWINSQLDKDTSISHNSKQLKKDMGINNAFIKSHEKENRNGKGHSKNNTVTFSYEN